MAVMASAGCTAGCSLNRDGQQSESWETSAADHAFIKPLHTSHPKRRAPGKSHRDPVTSPLVVQSSQHAGDDGAEYPLPLYFYVSCVCQVVIGATCIACQVALLCLASKLSIVVYGIWTGLFFITSGVLGMRAYNKKTRYSVIVFLVMAVLAAVVTIALFLLSLFEMLDGGLTMDRAAGGEYVMTVALMLILLAMTQATFATVSSGMACNILCCQETYLVVTGQMQCVTGADGEQRLVSVPLTQQGEPSASAVQRPTVSCPEEPRPYSNHQTPPPKYAEDQSKVPLPV